MPPPLPRLVLMARAALSATDPEPGAQVPPAAPAVVLLWPLAAAVLLFTSLSLAVAELGLKMPPPLPRFVLLALMVLPPTETAPDAQMPPPSSKALLLFTWLSLTVTELELKMPPPLPRLV